MQTWQIDAMAVVAIVALGLIAFVIYRRRRTRLLQEHFGAEYDHAVSEIGDRRRAEADLAEREARVRKLQVRELSPSDRDRLEALWKQCQAQFVDDPAGAVHEADRLVTDIMHTRGYSILNAEDRIAQISAACPALAAGYRSACYVGAQYRSGNASTEDLRQAFIHYRALFDDLLVGGREDLKRAS